MLPENQQIVSPKKFDELLSEQAVIAEFPTKDAEANYERRDAFLIHLIRREVERHFGEHSDAIPFVGDDWWPNHTRHLEAKPEHCTAAFLGALRGLLQDEFADYRFQVCVYGKNYIGSMALYAERVVIERDLHAFLTSTKKRL